VKGVPRDESQIQPLGHNIILQHIYRYLQIYQHELTSAQRCTNNKRKKYNSALLKTNQEKASFGRMLLLTETRTPVLKDRWVPGISVPCLAWVKLIKKSYSNNHDLTYCAFSVWGGRGRSIQPALSQCFVFRRQSISLTKKVSKKSYFDAREQKSSILLHAYGMIFQLVGIFHPLKTCRIATRTKKLAGRQLLVYLVVGGVHTQKMMNRYVLWNLIM